MLVWNNRSLAVAAADSVDIERWQAELETAFEQVGARFARRDVRSSARDLLTGLLAPLERKNCWTIAEHAGHETPHRLQHPLGRAVWDANVLAHLADPDAVLVVDETGDLKKGAATVGVQRQYSGTAGRIENCQVAVFLTYAAAGGHAFVDRRLYLPESWTNDPARRAHAGVPDDARLQDLDSDSGTSKASGLRGYRGAWHEWGAELRLRQTVPRRRR